MLVVDDDSRDGTAQLADALARADAAVAVLHRPGKAGLGRAYMAGFAAALAGGADFVVEMDADLSHDPADLPRLVAAARGRRRPRARLALRARRRRRELGTRAARALALRLRATPGACSACGCAT